MDAALAGIARLAARLGPAAGAALVVLDGGAVRVAACSGAPPRGTLRARILGGSPVEVAGGAAAAAVREGARVVAVLEVESEQPLAVDAGAILVDLAAQATFLLAQQRRLTAVVALARRQTEEAGRQGEDEGHFRLALDALGARIVILDGDGRIVAVNKAWRDYAVAEGRPRSGPGHHYLAEYERAAAAGSAEADRTAAGIRAVATGMQSRFELEFAGRGSDRGRWFSLRVTRFPRHDRGWVVVAHTDITERLRAQEALRDSRERFAGIIASALDAIITIDARDRITVFNAAAERMFGWRADEVAGAGVGQLLPQAIQETQLARLRALRAAPLPPERQAGSRLLRGIRRGGQSFPLEASISRLDTADGILVTIVARDVTERERAQRALARSEQRWALAVQGSNDGIWDWSVDEGVWFSPRCHEMLGYRAEEFPHDLEHWLGLLHPDDREAVCESLVANVLGAAPLLAIEYRARCRDGGWKWLLTRGRAEAEPGRSARRMAGSTADISARKLSEIALRASQARGAAIIASSLDAILAMDPHGRIISANPAAERMFGWPAAEIAGRDLRHILVLPGPEAHLPGGLAGHLAGLVGKRVEHEAVRADGARFPIEMAVVTVPLDERVMFIGHLRDLSEQRAAEARMRRHEQQLIQSEKMVALGTLVSGVAHEINNPANFISLNTPLLLRMWHGVLPVLDAHAAGDPAFGIGALAWSEVRTLVPQCHDGIQEGVRRIKRIVNDLKDFARDETPGVADEVELGTVVATAVRLAEHTVRKWTHALRLELGGEPLIVTGSHQRLEQVVINLLINACQALPCHDRAIRVRTGVDPESGMAVIEVADEGAGIPPEVLPRIMEPFFTTKRDIGGTGLGLSVSAAIIAEHGGTLAFTSQVGVGTTARVTLPLERQPG